MVAILALAGAVLAGCVAEPGGPAADDAWAEVPTARQPGVEDPHRILVDVVDGVTGDPVAGALVVFFTKHPINWSHGLDPSSPWYYDDVDDCAGLTPDTPPFEVLAWARTGPEGRVVGLLNASFTWAGGETRLPFNVVVGGLERYTTEAQVETAGISGACGMTGSLLWDATRLPERTRVQEVALYPAETEVEVEGRMPGIPPAGAPLVWGDNATWDPHPITHGRHLSSRVHAVDLELTWRNTATGFGDLYLGVGGSECCPEIVGEDRMQRPTDEDNLERLNATGLGRSYHGYFAGPLTDRGVVAPSGLEYEIRGTVTFRGALLDLSGVAADG